MKGSRYSNNGLAMDDLYELADCLCLDLHSALGYKVFDLKVDDIRSLIKNKVADLIDEDKETLAWYCWHLFQQALETE